MSLHFPKRYSDFAARMRVFTGFLMVAAFAWLSRPSARSLAVGLPLSLAGLLLRGWAAGHLEKNTRLTIGGPYAFVRNPLYLGTLLAAAGFAAASRQWLLAAVFALVFVFIYLPAIELEQQHLRNLFPDYEAYARRVPMLVPLLRPVESSRHFSWRLYARNREYEALLGFLAGAAWLIARG